jgi:hypothetical protein
MEIESINSQQLINPLHMEFTIDRERLFEKYNPDMLKVRPQYDVFHLWAGREDVSYKWVIRNIDTELKAEADHARDHALSGLAQGVSFLEHSLDPEVVDAAKRVKILLDTYNQPTPVTKLPYDAETAAITNLLQELNGNVYAAYILRLGLGSWVTELQTRNQAFAALAEDYHDAQVQRPEFTLKEARQGVDHAYVDLTKQINAWIRVEGETNWAGFVHELNTMIRHYKDVVAQHLGRVHSKKNKAE